MDPCRHERSKPNLAIFRSGRSRSAKVKIMLDDDPLRLAFVRSPDGHVARLRGPLHQIVARRGILDIPLSDLLDSAGAGRRVLAPTRSPADAESPVWPAKGLSHASLSVTSQNQVPPLASGIDSWRRLDDIVLIVRDPRAHLSPVCMWGIPRNWLEVNTHSLGHSSFAHSSPNLATHEQDLLRKERE